MGADGSNAAIADHQSPGPVRTVGVLSPPCMGGEIFRFKYFDGQEEEVIGRALAWAENPLLPHFGIIEATSISIGVRAIQHADWHQARRDAAAGGSNGHQQPPAGGR